MQDSDIQWCDDTVNLTMGCDGCELWITRRTQQNTRESAGTVTNSPAPREPHKWEGLLTVLKERKICYAGILSEMRKGQPGYPPSFEDVTLFPGRVVKYASLPDLRGRARPMKPWLNGLPRLIFVSDMSDALSKAVPFEYLEHEIVNQVTSEQGKRHCWLWLTKRPERMAEFSNWLNEWGRAWPSNLWAATSITTQGTTTRIDSLLKVGNEGTIRFVSVEPQWEAIDLTKWLPSLNWVIQGGQSGGGDVHEFQLEWAYAMLQQCRSAGVLYFLKQLGKLPTHKGKLVAIRDDHGGDWSEWPKDLQVREVPPA